MLEDLGAFRTRARLADAAVFARELGGPVLLVSPFESADEVLFATSALAGGAPRKKGALRLARVQKRAGSNAFTHMITVGRAPNNDIVLDQDGVSKFHASFALETAGAVLVDQGSRFGTFVDGRQITARTERAPLADGATLRFGQVEVRYFTAVGLHAELLRT